MKPFIKPVKAAFSLMETPDSFTKLSVPALTWAIFPDPQCDLQKLWVRIYSEWFPTSEYEQAEAPSFEMYYRMAGHRQGEIWIPVKKITFPLHAARMCNAGIEGERPQRCGRPFSFFMRVCSNGHAGVARHKQGSGRSDCLAQRNVTTGNVWV
ncbi:GyrI-like domain-containing protein [Paenibacillus sp. GYB003]|uniref:GyrI-like domain-containing protein n=1 Tax=Paenibacillus sp. GYB003 TaxID=2994392 RepID=UPI003FA6A5F4